MIRKINTSKFITNNWWTKLNLSPVTEENLVYGTLVTAQSFGLPEKVLDAVGPLFYAYADPTPA